MRDVIIGTAGHIDHGKTTLVKALTGIDTDRLEEEKRRGITIDIGFAHLEVDGYRIGFIDVPGHEKFVKNMLAGIGGIDVALLVVAANESVMPQTIEHFEICTLLDIPKGVVAITKKDQVDGDLLALVEEEVRELTAGTFMADSPIVAVDSVSGSGLENLLQALLQVVRQVDPDQCREGEVFRMPIDRVFTIRGFGTVVTGTPSKGVLAKDEAVAVYPSGRTGKVRGIEVFNQAADAARAGQRTALNISGLEKQDLERGMVLARPAAFVPSHMFDAVLSLVPRTARPLKHGSPIRFHQGSAELLGKVYLLEGQEILPGASGLVQLRLDTPTVCCPKDHFIVRSYSPATTIGGGIILDNAPGKHTKKESAEIVPLLHRLVSGTSAFGARTSRPLSAGILPAVPSAPFDHLLLDYLVSRARTSGLDLDQLGARTGRTASALLADLQGIESITLVPQDPPIAVSREIMTSAATKVIEYVGRFHAANPLAPGVSREELKTRVMPAATGPIFQSLLDQLVASRQIQLNAASVLPFGVQADLDESQSQIRTSILQRLSENPYQPPTLDELCLDLGYPASDVRRIFHFLLGRGELVRVTTEIVLPAADAESLKAQVRESFQGAAFGVAEFKEIFNVSRKYAIPMLEYLDREKVTRRAGDKRIVL